MITFILILKDTLVIYNCLSIKIFKHIHHHSSQIIKLFFLFINFKLLLMKSPLSVGDPRVRLESEDDKFMFDETLNIDGY